MVGFGAFGADWAVGARCVVVPRGRFAAAVFFGCVAAGLLPGCGDGALLRCCVAAALLRGGFATSAWAGFAVRECDLLAVATDAVATCRVAGVGVAGTRFAASGARFAARFVVLDGAFDESDARGSDAPAPVIRRVVTGLLRQARTSRPAPMPADCPVYGVGCRPRTVERGSGPAG